MVFATATRQEFITVPFIHVDCTPYSPMVRFFCLINMDLSSYECGKRCTRLVLHVAFRILAVRVPPCSARPTLR